MKEEEKEGETEGEQEHETKEWCMREGYDKFESNRGRYKKGGDAKKVGA